MTTQAQPDPISLATVLVDLFFEGKDLEVNGTGFVIRTRHGPFLVTAGHVVTGRHPDGKCLHSQGALPNQITITNFFGPLVKVMSLYADNNDPNTAKALYRRHPEKAVDVAIVPLPPAAAQYEANLLDETLWRPETMCQGIPILNVADPCHVIGYPEGLTNRVGADRVLPLWKTGHLATDPHYDFTNEKIGLVKAPLCLVDATTRPGQSGAPVFVVNNLGVTDSWREAGQVAYEQLMSGGRLRRMPMPSGLPTARRTRLVGIYSGRTSGSSDLGMVWKPAVLHELLEKNYPGW